MSTLDGENDCCLTAPPTGVVVLLPAAKLVPEVDGVQVCESLPGKAGCDVTFLGGKLAADTLGTVEILVLLVI